MVQKAFVLKTEEVCGNCTKYNPIGHTEEQHGICKVSGRVKGADNGCDCVVESRISAVNHFVIDNIEYIAVYNNGKLIDCIDANAGDPWQGCKGCAYNDGECPIYHGDH